MVENPAIQAFLRGGPVMFVLLALSILMVAIVLVKVSQFRASGLGDTAFIDHVLGAVREDHADRAGARLALTPHPIARVFETAIEASASGRPWKEAEASIHRAGSDELGRLESRLSDLELIATIAPLLGLLGTVLGMIQAFAEVERFGSTVDPSLLAGGIWQALLTTAFGLIVAIPALAAAHVFQSKVDRLRDLMGDSVSELLALASLRRGDS